MSKPSSNGVALTAAGGRASGAAAGGSDGGFWKRAFLLLGCSLGIYATFLLYGILQERMYSHQYGVNKDKFNYSLFLVFFQCIGNSLFALAMAYAFPVPRTGGPTPPASAYFYMSASYIGAMFSSNLALAFMSYPAQALAKSCKLIPVMLSRLFIMKEVKYTRREVLQVILITGGIVVFMLSAEKESNKKQKETSWLGLGLCILSLALDGYTGPAQEKLSKEHKQATIKYQKDNNLPPTPVPDMGPMMMFYLNMWAVLLVAVALVVSAPFTGELQAATRFCLANPGFLPEAAVFSLMAASGQALILYTLLQFNSLVVVTVTTTRKFFTILLSVVMFGHSLNSRQWGGVALVFVGLSLDIYVKYAERNSHGHGSKHGGDHSGSTAPTSPMPLVAMDKVHAPTTDVSKRH